MRAPGSHRLRDAVCTAILAAAALLLYRDALALGFSHDDPMILATSLFAAPWEFFVDAEVQRRHGAVTFTPMLGASYAVDGLLFGRDPQGYHAHTLVLVAVLPLLAYAVLRRRHRGAAVAAALAFLLSGPVAIAARVLMNRNYLEGALWALAAFLLLRRANCGGGRAARGGVAWLAALCSLAAMLNKEVYVALGLAAPLWADGNWRRRLAATWPVLAALVPYAPWRLLMLPGWGGYTTVGVRDVLHGDVAWRGLWAIPQMLVGCTEPDGVVDAGGVLVAMVGAALFCRAPRRQAWAGAATAALGLACLLPVWRHLPDPAFPKTRLVVHVALLLALALGAALARALARGGAWRWVGGALAAAVLAALLAQNLALSRVFRASTRCHYHETDFVMTAPGDRVLVTATPFPYREYAAATRRRFGEDTPLVCGMGLDLRDARGERYFAFDGASGEFVDVTAAFAVARRQLLDHLTDDPLAVTATSRDGVLDLDIDHGGVPGAVYLLLLGQHPQLYQAMPTRAVMRRHRRIEPGTRVRVLRLHPGGRFALSPEWNVADPVAIDWSS